MNPYLSNTFPDLTDQELSFLGSYMISYFNDSTNCMVASNGSFELFYHHAGIKTQCVKDYIKQRAYEIGQYTLINPKTDNKVTIFVWDQL